MAHCQIVNGMIRQTDTLDVKTKLNAGEGIITTFEVLIDRLNSLEFRVKELETAYMEKVLLGSEPGKIEE